MIGLLSVRPRHVVAAFARFITYPSPSNLIGPPLAARLIESRRTANHCRGRSARHAPTLLCFLQSRKPLEPMRSPTSI
jgi:hypothetical protein